MYHLSTTMSWDNYNPKGTSLRLLKKKWDGIKQKFHDNNYPQITSFMNVINICIFKRNKVSTGFLTKFKFIY